MKIYLFAIGGSGARVLRSLTMLLAAGVEFAQKNTELVPIILDPDQGAGNLTETVQLLKDYQRIRRLALEHDTKGHISTFTTNIAPLPGQEFLIPLEGVAGTKFQDYIQVNAAVDTHTPPSASKDLVQTLFSPENLNLDMQVGFKGNPNIGSIVLGQFERSSVFEDFMNDFSATAGDKRIFIVSSIFGGTGASGFPTLLKGLRQARLATHDAHIGALSLQPYFAVSNNPDSAIDSRTFFDKTRAALLYYLENIIKNNDIDDFYSLGDKKPERLENKEGGAEQRNGADFLELAGALSLFHFAQQPLRDRKNGRATMYEFGIRDSSDTTISFQTLGPNTEKQLACPLTALYLMHRYMEQHDLTTSPDAWLKDIQPNIDSSFVSDLGKFLENYYKWLEELGQGARQFAPIKLIQHDSNLFDCVEGYPVTIGFLDKMMKKQNFSLYTDRLNAYAKEHGMPTTSGELLSVLSDVSYGLCTDKINLPTN